MKIRSKIIGAAVATTIAMAPSISSATICLPKTPPSVSHGSNAGPLIVGCIMGSAFGAITASIRKASAMGNPPRWRSQAEHERIVKSGYEKQFELTSAEAATALALCGLGSFALHWKKQVPVKAHVVRARY